MKMAKKRGKETTIPFDPEKPVVDNVTWMIPIVEEKFDLLTKFF